MGALDPRAREGLASGSTALDGDTVGAAGTNGLHEGHASPSRGLDGTAELAAELHRLSRSSRVAANAPRDMQLYTFLNLGIAAGGPWGDSSEYLAVAHALVQRLSIWWPPEIYAELPVLVPWAIRDRSARYDMGPEMWSAPRDDGYLRDDNSIIKKLPLPLTISAPLAHPYGGRKPWRGFMACHLWRDLPDGSRTGTSPWLYSFVPNLVWLPMPFARLSDIEAGPIQSLLQRTSIALYRAVRAISAVEDYQTSAWAALPEPEPGEDLDLDKICYFNVDRAFVRRRLSYIDRFISGAESVLTTGRLERKLISTRYTAGFQLLDHASIAAFADALRAYRTAVTTRIGSA